MSLNSRLITLNNGVAAIGTRPISNHELAERLEIAEEVIQLREQVKQIPALMAQVEFLNKGQLDLHTSYQEKISALSERLGDESEFGNDLQEMFKTACDERNNLRDTVQEFRNRAEETEEQLQLKHTKLVEAMQETQRLSEYTAELKDAGDALAAKSDTLEEECRRLSVNHAALARKLEAEQKAHKAIQAQLKKLKELDPERLKGQVANLKKANKEKQTAIEALRKQNHEFVRDNNAKAKTIAQLDIVLEKACDDINEQNTPEPIDVINCGNMGKWNVYGTRMVNCYDVMDVKNDVSMRIHVENGVLTVPDLRTPPKSLQKKIIDRAARYVATEKRIEDDQKPLEQGAV